MPRVRGHSCSAAARARLAPLGTPGPSPAPAAGPARRRRCGDSSRLRRTLRLAAPRSQHAPAPPRCLRFSQAPGVSAACVEVCQGIVLCECVCVCVCACACAVGCGAPAAPLSAAAGKGRTHGASLFRERFPGTSSPLRRERSAPRLAAGLQKVLLRCPRLDMFMFT